MISDIVKIHYRTSKKILPAVTGCGLQSLQAKKYGMMGRIKMLLNIKYAHLSAPFEYLRQYGMFTLYIVTYALIAAGHR